MAIIGAIPNTLSAGNDISATQLNANFQHIVSQVNSNAMPAYTAVPYVWTRLGTLFVSSADQWVKVTGFTIEVSDSMGLFSGDVFTAQSAGLYWFSTGGYSPSPGDSQRYAFEIRKNGLGTQFSGGNMSLIDTPLSGTSIVLPMAVGDYAEVWMFSNISITLNAGNSNHSFYFQAAKIG